MPIQAKSSGRRKNPMKHWGTPPMEHNYVSHKQPDSIPTKIPQQFYYKRPHSLKENISKGQQNSGKW